MASSLPEEKVFKVSELTQLVKLTLETQFPAISVLGEASGVVLASSGHLYFTLKDAAGAMKVVMFRGSLLKSTLNRLENGQQIVVRGRSRSIRRAARCRSSPATCACRGSATSSPPWKN